MTHRPACYALRMLPRPFRFSRGFSLSLLLWAALACTPGFAVADAAVAGLSMELGAELDSGPRMGLRTGLVLSGGGARGAAHVGVLRELEAAHVRIDAIAGTSMGAVVGGLYASGVPLDDIETLFRSTDWEAAFRDRAPRSDLGFRRKQDDREFLVRVPLGVRGTRLVLPQGLVQGQKLLATLRRMTLPVANVAEFDQLPIPFRAMATDIVSGEGVALSRGDLAQSLRASLSAPGVFAPVELDGRLLVDGGLTANLPVDLARQMGVDRLIVVDVSFPMVPRSSLTSALELSNQAITVLMAKETQRARNSLGTQDLLIVPALGEFGSTDFLRLGLAIDLGAAAAAAQRTALARYAIAGAAWQEREVARLARHGVPAVGSPTLASVTVQASTAVQQRWLEAALMPEQGRVFAPERIERRVAKAYGRDVFEIIDWRLQRDATGVAGLQVDGRGKSWGPNFLSFGLDLQDDFAGNNSFNAGVRLLGTELNAFGAEWRWDVQFGEAPRLASEFHQPLGLSSPWFMAARAVMESRNVPVMAGGERVAEFRVRETLGGLDLGREFGLCCELRFGFQRALGSLRLRVGEVAALPVGVPALDGAARAEYTRREWFGRFTFDGLDNVHFPREGGYFRSEWTGSRESVGADRGSDRVELAALRAWSAGRHTFVLGLDAGTTVAKPTDAVDRLFQLGGFLRLSGLPAGSVSGAHYALGRAVVLRKIGQGGNGFFDVPAWVGLSLEAGNVWATRREAAFAGLRKDAALFLGLDTGLGPVYLGGGLDEDGNSAWYLFLGRGF